MKFTVRAGDGEVRDNACAPDARAELVDAVLHGRGGERVDPVEARVAGIGARGGESVGWATVVLAGQDTGCGRSVEGA